MGEPLRVLVYGSVDDGACDTVRLGVYREPLRDHAVELRTWGEFNDYRIQIPEAYRGRLDDAVRDGVAAIDTSPLEWADVLVFRRWYGTVHACEDCDYAAPDEATLAGHTEATGHAAVARDHIVRILLSSIEADRTVLGGRAIVYELDDDLLSPQPWLGFYRRMAGDRDLIERFARVADLVTVATPTLAASLRPFNAAVRVIRNAVVPEWYGPPPADLGSRPLSFLYYGAGARYRDYAICQDAVDEVARASGARRIWLGSDEPGIREIVDDARPYVPRVPDFARTLVEARPAIGVAPVGQDAYSRGRSELHWLEYSLAGAATVASRSMGGGIRFAGWRLRLSYEKNWQGGPANAFWRSTTFGSAQSSGRKLSPGRPNAPVVARRASGAPSEDGRHRRLVVLAGAELLAHHVEEVVQPERLEDQPVCAAIARRRGVGRLTGQNEDPHAGQWRRATQVGGQSVAVPVRQADIYDRQDRSILEGERLTFARGVGSQEVDPQAAQCSFQRPVDVLIIVHDQDGRRAASCVERCGSCHMPER